MNNFVDKLNRFTQEADSWRVAMNNEQMCGFGASIKALWPSFFKGQAPLPLKSLADNNQLLWGSHFGNLPVFSPKQLADKNHKIVVFPADYERIKQNLDELGLNEYEDYLYYSDFLSLMHWVEGRRVFLPTVHISITSRCTLNCKNCNMFIPKYQDPADESLESLTTDLDILFSHVDHIQDIEILGGEPLLHPQLENYLESYKPYRDKCGAILLLTNGTIIPSESILKVCQELGVFFSISDYNTHGMVHYKSRIEALVDTLKKWGIAHRVLNADVWNRFADSDGHLVQLPPTELRKHYLRCNPIFRGFQGGRFYPCHLSWSADKCGLQPSSVNDYLDFKLLSVGNEYDRLSILKTDMRDGGYPSLCRYCNGCDPQYYYPIPVAEQAKRSVN